MTDIVEQVARAICEVRDGFDSDTLIDDPEGKVTELHGEPMWKLFIADAQVAQALIDADWLDDTETVAKYCERVGKEMLRAALDEK